MAARPCGFSWSRVVRGALAWVVGFVTRSASCGAACRLPGGLAGKLEAVGRRFTFLVLLALGVGLTAPSAQADAPRPADPRSRGGWLGVSMDTNASLDGVLVRHVVRTSPADKAGLRAGDRLLKIDGTAVTSATQVTRIVSGRSVGDVIPVLVRRADKESTAQVELGARPSVDEILKMDHVGTFAPAWTGTTSLTGAPPSLAAMCGRVVLLDFWASWCGPCRFAVPKLSQLDAKYRGQGLSVVGMTTDEAEVAATAAARLGMKYGVVVDDKAQTSSAYGVSALPTLFVIDKRGVIRHVVMGYDPSEDAKVEQLVQQLLAEPAPPPSPPPAASGSSAPPPSP